METTKDLLRNYIELQETIAAFGPCGRLLAQRRVLDVSMQAHQVEQEYLALKEKYPDPIEFLEMATPLTAADRRNLEKAAAVNNEIEKLLGASKRRRKKANH